MIFHVAGFPIVSKCNFKNSVGYTETCAPYAYLNSRLPRKLCKLKLKKL